MLEHRFSIVLILATFALLWIGGTVNPTGSSLACPEPTLICNGQLFPPMVGGVHYEHGHRLVATSVGILQIVLTVLLWRRRPGLRGAGLAALGLVCFQGTLGAITVAYQLPWAVSTLHLLTAFVYLSLLMWIAWRTRPEGSAGLRPDIGAARGWILVAAAAVLAQILLGGLVRHHEAALASVQLPLHEGSLWWPAGAPLALKLHLLHRLVGVAVGIVVVAAAVAVWRRARGWASLRGLAAASVALVAVQITLGILTILTFRSTPIAVAHFAGASMLWASWVIMILMTGTTRVAPRRLALEPALAGRGAS
jgi:heme A synthase